MKKTTRAIFFAFVLLTVSSGCSKLSTSVPSTEMTVAPTSSLESDNSKPSSALEGFKQQYISDLNINVLIPDGWFYKWVTNNSTKAFFITKEDIDTTGRFSTGLTVNVKYDVENVDETAKSFVSSMVNQNTTTKVLGKSIKISNKANTKILYGASVEAKLPVNKNDPNPNPEKTLSYFAISDTQTKTLYLMIFESPRKDWDTEWYQFGIQITESIINDVLGE
jgi:hypothetical protein